MAIKNYAERFSALAGERGLVNIFLGIFLFLQPFSRYAGVRNTAFVLLVLVFLARIVAGKVKIEWKDKTVLAFLGIFAVSVISSVLSPYMADSLDALRKNLLYQALIFFIILSEYRTVEDLKPVFYYVFAGFAALTTVIIVQTPFSGLLDWIKQVEAGNKLLRGYSLFATFYIPLGAAYFYFMKDSRAVKWVLCFIIVLEFILSVLNNHRGQVAAIVVSVFLMTILARRFKAVALGFAVCFITGAVILYFNPDGLNRYKTLANPANYVSNSGEGLNDRVAIWRGTLDMIKDRPLLGWGYGWKKISTVVNEKGYLDIWDKEDRSYLFFNKAKYGAANPHNLILQVLFEIGAAGLFALLFFWATIAAKALKTFMRRGEGPAEDFLKYGFPGVMVSYIMVNTVNGLWEEAYGVLIITFAAFCVVAYRQWSTGGKAAV